MTVRLSAAELQGVERVAHALLRPLEYANVDLWREAVGAELKALLGADMATWYLPIAGVRPYFSADVPVGVASSYPARVRPLDRRWSVWDRQAALGVSDRSILWRPAVKELRRSAYYNDWVVPNRLFSALTMSVRMSQNANSPLQHGPPVPTVWLHHERRHAGGFGARGRAILHRVLPAYAAGIEIARIGADRRQALARMLDDLGLAILIVDDAGTPVHRTPALQRLLTSDPQSTMLVGAMMAAAASVARIGASGARLLHAVGQADDVATKVRTVSGTYRVRAAVAPSELCGARPCAIVFCERASAPAPDAATLVERHGLTPAQARVALLIAGGHSAEMIASALGLSIHTVRRHSEQIRARLGVHRVGEVMARLTAPVER